MERLSGLDASFLYLETPTMHMHVCATIVFDPSTMPGGYSFDKVKEFLQSRLHLVPPYRRKLATVPFNLDHPYWVEDAEFDMGTPWYRPTRVVQLVSGADYAWRGVTGRWPPYFPDHAARAVATRHGARASA